MPYLADTNPFSLSAPPQWWIDGLAAFDPDLVVIPSRQKPIYLLARKRKLSKGITPPSAHFAGDVGMLHAHDLISIDKFFQCASWTMAHLQELVKWLKSCDTWAVDGPLTEADIRRAAFEGSTKAMRLANANDDADRAKIDAANRDAFWHAAGEGYRSMKARTGQRILNAGKSQPIG